MARRIFNLLSALFLVLFLLTAALWARSYLASDRWEWIGGSRSYWLHSYSGAITFSDWSDPTPADSSEMYFSWSANHHQDGYDRYSQLAPSPAPFLGFGYLSAESIIPRGHNVRLLRIPLWFPAALTAILPLIWLFKRRRLWRRHDRTLLGLCIHCGYDLRATPGRCPECGAATPAIPTPPDSRRPGPLWPLSLMLGPLLGVAVAAAVIYSHVGVVEIDDHVLAWIAPLWLGCILGQQWRAWIKLPESSQLPFRQMIWLLERVSLRALRYLRTWLAWISAGLIPAAAYWALWYIWQGRYPGGWGALTVTLIASALSAFASAATLSALHRPLLPSLIAIELRAASTNAPCPLSPAPTT